MCQKKDGCGVTMMKGGCGLLLLGLLIPIAFVLIAIVLQILAGGG